MEDKIANTINKPFEEYILNEVLSMAEEGYFEENNSKKTLIVDSIQSKGTTFNTFFNGIKKFVKENYKPNDYHKVLEGILKNVYFATNSHKEYKGVCKILGKSHCCLFNSKGTLTFGKKGMEGKELHFNKAIMNPPYSIGGKIWDEARKVSDLVICLMPLAQYKEGDRIKYIASYKPVGGEGFDAIITDNLCITTSQSMDNGKTYEDFLFDSFNQNYRDFYEWNRRNYKGLEVCRRDNKPYTDFDINLDFIETNRLCSPKNIGGSGFGKGGCGYKFNVLKEGYEKKWIKGIALIHLNSQKEKDNFSEWWYSAPKEKGLSSKVMFGLNMVTVSILTKYAIPQIDWEKISDHPLWQEGKYDEAVLDTMGLKWEGDKIVEVR